MNKGLNLGIWLGAVGIGMTACGMGKPPLAAHLDSTGSARLTASFENRSAAEKQGVLWSKIERSRYEQLPLWKSIDVFRFALLNMSVSMDRVSDEMPEGRNKMIHTYGSVAKCQFIPAVGQPFSGLFAGSSYGLIRLSLAADPQGLGVTPGLALKFMVDGAPSENLIAMFSLDGQGDNSNFFANTFSNIVSEPNNQALKVLKLIFARASKHPTKLSLVPLSSIAENGQTVAPALIRAPAQVFLVPSQEAQLPSAPGREFRRDLETLPAGTTLYTLYGTEKEGSARILIGQVQTTSDFVASKYGDENLFFRHRRHLNE